MSKARELAELIGNAGGTSEQVLSGRRNLIINGAMQVAQRGTSFGPNVNNAYSLDRWYRNSSGATTELTQSTTTTPSLAGGIKTYCAFNVTTGDNYTCIRQRIEDVDSIAGTATVSFYAKGVSPVGGLRVWFTQNFGSNGSADVDWLETQTITLTSSWQRFEVQVTIPSVDSKTIGAGSFLQIAIGQYNYDATAWNIDITGVQLELGSVATPFEHRSYGEELALCQRYYLRLVPATTSCFIPHYGQTSNHMRGAYYLPCEMRATPSGVKSGNMYAKDANGSTAIDSISVQNMQGNQLNVNMWHTGSNRNGTSYYYSCTVEFDAEL